eukprot:scaffold27856_cov55-Phaeocystis_antarctica.AAC.2
MNRGCGDDVEMIVVVVSVICPKACCKSGSIVARSLLAPTLRPPPPARTVVPLRKGAQVVHDGGGRCHH